MSNVTKIDLRSKNHQNIILPFSILGRGREKLPLKRSLITKIQRYPFKLATFNLQMCAIFGALNDFLFRHRLNLSLLAIIKKSLS